VEEKKGGEPRFYPAEDIPKPVARKIISKPTRLRYRPSPRRGIGRADARGVTGIARTSPWAREQLLHSGLAATKGTVARRKRESAGF